MTTHPLAQKPVCDAILLWSFPKCGRTWLRYLFLHLYDQHLAAEHVVEGADPRFKIVLIRNLLDVMVSYYFEVRYRTGFGIPRRRLLSARWLLSDQTIRSFVRCGAAEAFLDFYDQCGRASGQNLLIRYEDLLNDTAAPSAASPRGSRRSWASSRALPRSRGPSARVVSSR
jgi:hypothetical protein